MAERTTHSGWAGAGGPRRGQRRAWLRRLAKASIPFFCGVAIAIAIVVLRSEPARDAESAAAATPYERADSHLRVVTNKTSLKRSTVDRPDDVPGPQVHPIYVVPADAPDRRLDVDGTLDDVIWKSQDWLAGAANRLSLRVDTYRGRPDISFFRSSRTHDWLLDQNLYIVREIRDELREADFSGSSEKILLVFYDGRMRADDDRPCGVSDGNAALVTVADSRCGPLDTSLFFVHRDKTIPHEVFHAAGQLPDAAPHSDGSGHSTDAGDLMYGKSQSPSRVGTLKVDPGHDDYWKNIVPWLTTNHHPIDIDIRGRGAIFATPWANTYLGPPSLCDDDCAMWYRNGTPVTLQAVTSDRGYRFASWRGSCTGAGKCQVTVDSARRVTAHFEKVANLDIQVRGPGVVRVGGRRTCRSSWCGYDFSPGSRAKVVAVPKSGARFVRWSGGCARGPRCQVVVEHRRDAELTAVFTGSAR
jgi:hypothetical protein